MNTRTTILTLLVWIVAASVGFSALARYESRPGAASATTGNWPADSHLPRTAGRPLLVVFAHPYCPCTNATLGNLDRLMAKCQDRMDAMVVFVALPGLSDDWKHQGLWEKAGAIKGVQTLCDDAGMEAKRFGAATSGQAFLYDAGGRLRFSGGLTESRGHEGDSDGCDAIVAAVINSAPGDWHTNVYGCSIFNEPPSPAPATAGKP